MERAAFAAAKGTAMRLFTIDEDECEDNCEALLDELSFDLLFLI